MKLSTNDWNQYFREFINSHRFENKWLEMFRVRLVNFITERPKDFPPSFDFDRNFIDYINKDDNLMQTRSDSAYKSAFWFTADQFDQWCITAEGRTAIRRMRLEQVMADE